MLTIGEFARLGQVSPRMLRHYDEIGVLRPERVDPGTGYRSYGVGQLARLHRLVALRDLGFGLEQIRPLLDDELGVEQLRGMLRLRHAQIAQVITDEHDRLRRVEAHLRALEGNPVNHDIVIKHTQPLRIAEATANAAGFGPEHLGPVFATLVPAVAGHLGSIGTAPGMAVAYYDEPAEDGAVVVHCGFAVGDSAVADDAVITVVDLPVVEVASVLHRGSMDTVSATYEGLFRWVDECGYRPIAPSRELYLEWRDDDESANLTELQLPVTR